MRVGFLGVQCDTANLGLAALAYSAVRVIHELLGRDTEFVFFSINSAEEIRRMRDQLGLTDAHVEAVPFRHKNPRAMLRSVREIRSCDVVIDFTGGDSFSDIYGIARLLRKLFHKQLVLWARRPLVLGPQTYGPLHHAVSRPWFRHVVNRAALVFTRDDLSAEFLSGLTDRDIHVSTDVAVTLPWDPSRAHSSPTGPTRVGLNVSGLLWRGGYTGDNQFELSANYRDYCLALTRSLLESGHEVHLVPHVLARPWESAREDDVSAALELQEHRPHCAVAPAFSDPVDAKSWISHMDVFVGSRMHATIAAFTTGVATVPVAYSRKFAGFFGSLGYPVLVDLVTLSTEDAVATTLQHVADRQKLGLDTLSANAEASRRIQLFATQLNALFDGF